MSITIVDNTGQGIWWRIYQQGTGHFWGNNSWAAVITLDPAVYSRYVKSSGPFTLRLQTYTRNDHRHEAPWNPQLEIDDVMPGDSIVVNKMDQRDPTAFRHEKVNRGMITVVDVSRKGIWFRIYDATNTSWVGHNFWTEKCEKQPPKKGSAPYVVKLMYYTAEDDANKVQFDPQLEVRDLLGGETIVVMSMTSFQVVRPMSNEGGGKQNDNANAAGNSNNSNNDKNDIPARAAATVPGGGTTTSEMKQRRSNPSSKDSDTGNKSANPQQQDPVKSGSMRVEMQRNKKQTSENSPLLPAGKNISKNLVVDAEDDDDDDDHSGAASGLLGKLDPFSPAGSWVWLAVIFGASVVQRLYNISAIAAVMAVTAFALRSRGVTPLTLMPFALLFVVVQEKAPQEYALLLSGLVGVVALAFLKFFCFSSSSGNSSTNTNDDNNNTHQDDDNDSNNKSNNKSCTPSQPASLSGPGDIVGAAALNAQKTTQHAHVESSNAAATNAGGSSKSSTQNNNSGSNNHNSFALGAGAFGSVSRALWKNHREVAIKQCGVPPSHPKFAAIRESMLRECSIHRRLKHPNIVECLAVINIKMNDDDGGEHHQQPGSPIFDPSELDRLAAECDTELDLTREHLPPADPNTCPALVLEWLPSGSVSKLIQQYGPLRDEKAMLKWFGDAARGLAYLHSKHIVHEDIKPANLLIAADGSAKLADFGLARVGRKHISDGNNVYGTSVYLSPECVSHAVWSPASDVWALACCALEMMTGRYPWQDEFLASPTSTGGNDAVIKLLLKHSQHGGEASAAANDDGGDNKLKDAQQQQQQNQEQDEQFNYPTPEFPPEGVLSQETKQMLLRCFNPDPKKRPTASDLVTFVDCCTGATRPNTAAITQRENVDTSTDSGTIDVAHALPAGALRCFHLFVQFSGPCRDATNLRMQLWSRVTSSGDPLLFKLEAEVPVPSGLPAGKHEIAVADSQSIPVVREGWFAGFAYRGHAGVIPFTWVKDPEMVACVYDNGLGSVDVGETAQVRQGWKGMSGFSRTRIYSFSAEVM